MAIKTIQHNKITWYHVDEMDEAGLKLIKNQFKFHPLDIKDVQGEAEESKIDIYRDYLFLILHFPVLHRTKGRVSFVELDIFLGKDFLITIQKGKFKPMKDIYYKIQNNIKYRKVCFSKDSGYLLYRILEVLYKDTKNITSYITRKLRMVEDDVYGDDVDENTAKSIAYLRRKVLDMKRIFDPQMEVMSELSQIKTKFLAADLNVYFDDIDDYIDKVTNFLENQKFILKDLLEVHDSLITHKTNKVIKVLTVFSVAMLPLTLLSGIYGMNINLPFGNNSMAVWGVFLILFIVVLSVVGVMRKKRLL